MQLSAIIMAGGLSKRFKSSKPKYLHELLGRPMITYPLDALLQLSSISSFKVNDIIIVVSPNWESELKDTVRTYISGLSSDRELEIRYVTQPEPRGTADAVEKALQLELPNAYLLILNADMPLLTAETLKAFLENCHGSSAYLATTYMPEPEGYGRVFKDECTQVLSRIVEDAHLRPEERDIREVNVGLYLLKRDVIEFVREVQQSPKGERYITDLFCLLVRKGYEVKVIYMPENSADFIGVNTRADLANALKILRNRINYRFMLNGVTILQPETVMISPDTSIGTDTIIYPNSYIIASQIGERCVIGPNAHIVRSKIGEGSHIWYTVAIEAQIGNSVKVGPFCYLRPKATLMDNSKAGTFVEIKKSTIGQGSKVPHLSYIGDTLIGRNVNIGAGTITCNYDGVTKHETVIEDEAFIGSNTSLVAPVKIGERAVTGAGSVVTRDIPPGTVFVGNPARYLKPVEQLRIGDARKRVKV